MIKNYLKIAWRSLFKNKVHSFINIAGLSVGMAVAILIGLWIWDELSYDKYHQNYDSIVQVMQHQTMNGEIGTQQSIPIPLGYKLRHDYKGDFKYAVLSTFGDRYVVANGNKKLTQTGNFMQPEAPEMLTLKMLRGSRNGLKDPSSILLSASLAKALFGNADPINQVLKIDNKLNVKVTGVYEDLPHNTTFNDMAFMAPWDLYLTTDPYLKIAENRWGNNSWQIIAQLRPGADINNVSAKIKNLKLEGLAAQGDKLGLSFKAAVFLQPMSRWYLYSEYKNGVNTGAPLSLYGCLVLSAFLCCCWPVLTL
jgi:putative ABC transport system permease protein